MRQMFRQIGSQMRHLSCLEWVKEQIRGHLGIKNVYD
jgi:hypothetical protein